MQTTVKKTCSECGKDVSQIKRGQRCRRDRISAILAGRLWQRLLQRRSAAPPPVKFVSSVSESTPSPASRVGNSPNLVTSPPAKETAIAIESTLAQELEPLTKFEGSTPRLVVKTQNSTESFLACYWGGHDKTNCNCNSKPVAACSINRLHVDASVNEQRDPNLNWTATQ